MGLEVDGRRLVQSGAILRYIARRWDLYGDEVLTDMAIEAGKDFASGVLSLPFAQAQGEDLTHRLSELRMHWLPQYCGPFEAVLTDNPWLGGASPTVGDAVVVRVVEECVEYLGDWCLQPWPLVADWRKRMIKDPRISAFLSSHHHLPS